MDATENHGLVKRRRIYLLRHGDVSYFDERGQPFRPDLVPLNAEGRKQAEAMAEELTGIEWDAVFSSDLPRCMETASIVTAGRTMAIQSREQSAEIQPGRLADIPHHSIREVFLQAFGSGCTRESSFLGGETFGSLIDRVQTFLAGLVQDRSWQQVLMVAHGGVNRVVLAHALGGGLETLGVIEQDTCCLNILDVDDNGRWLVRLLNHTPYNRVKTGLVWTTMERLFLEYRARRESPTM